MLPPWLRVLPGLTPSATVSLVLGERPVLVDTGSGSPHARARIETLLAAEGLRVDDLDAALLTHAHDDHVGGAAWVRSHGVPLALHADDVDQDPVGGPVSAATGPPATPHCDRGLLAFDVEPFEIDRRLQDGDVVAAGDRELVVVHVPSQMPGHVAFWEPVDRVLFSGDLLQADDVAWVRWFEDDAIDKTVAAVRRLAALEPRLVVPGHGPVVDDVPAAVERTLAKYASWSGDRVRPARHAGSRAAVQTLVHRPRTLRELGTLPWARHYADALEAVPEDALHELLARLQERGAVREDGGVWSATVPAEGR